MSESLAKAQFAWQPLTVRGVAVFARARLGQLLLVQFLVALLAGGTVAWFLHRNWFPPIREAIGQMPAQGELRSGRLDWQGPSPARLAEGRFLAVIVDLEHSGEARSPAHVEVELGRTNCMAFSLFGFARSAYPRGWAVAFNRTALGPWWGAWAPAILAITVGVVAASLMAAWAGLATVYCLPVWLVGFFADRELSLAGSWRLAGAALMPGALFMCAVVVLYGCGVLDLVRLAVAGPLHLVVAWGYLILSPWRLPKHAAAETRANPFA